MNENEIIKIIKESVNKHQSLMKLGWDTRTVGYRKLNKFILINNVNITHFETRSQQMKRQGLIFSKKIPLSNILISRSTYSNTTKLKKKLYDEGLKERICEKCGQDENWNNEKISLILDHINGIHDDNRIENLRIVCPNCNATLPTHCGKNMKKKSIKKNKLSDDERFVNKKIQSINNRVNQRPSYKQLLDDVDINGYTGTGRKYGVSDNSIRKWIKFYEKYN